MTPFVFIIFGATGDLTHRKIMPALYNLVKKGEIDTPVFFVGVGRREMTADQFAELMAGSVHDAEGQNFDGTVWAKLFSGFEYVQGDFGDANVYAQLVKVLEQFDATMKACVPRFFYLATPPAHYETILKNLRDAKLSEGCGQGTNIYTRLLIEKPFGRDVATAKMLDTLLGSIFEEKQIYRIDHYLGKETVQNLLALRFANGIFEPTWNREFVDHVQITLAEDIGVGSRGMFYEGVGAIRDVVQNHMLEMIALVAMDSPKAFDAQSTREARVAALKAIQKVKLEDVIKGQYEGYAEEVGVAAASQTETFAAVKLMVNSKRWEGVPFYLRTGKKLAKKATEISIHYKKPIVCTGPACLFNEQEVKRNILAIRIQPDEGVALRLMVKKPGFNGMSVVPVSMNFSYQGALGELGPAEYEKLLMDSIIGDQTLFSRTDGIAATWNALEHVIQDGIPLHKYTPGSLGPKEADEFIEKDGRYWFLGQ